MTIDEANKIIGVDGTAPTPVPQAKGFSTPGEYRTAAHNDKDAVNRIVERAKAAERVGEPGPEAGQAADDQ